MTSVMDVLDAAEVFRRMTVTERIAHVELAKRRRRLVAVHTRRVLKTVRIPVRALQLVNFQRVRGLRRVHE